MIVDVEQAANALLASKCQMVVRDKDETVSAPVSSALKRMSNPISLLCLDYIGASNL